VIVWTFCEIVIYISSNEKGRPSPPFSFDLQPLLQQARLIQGHNRPFVGNINQGNPGKYKYICHQTPSLKLSYSKNSVSQSTQEKHCSLGPIPDDIDHGHSKTQPVKIGCVLEVA
jgi:hypothetical protein